MAGVIGAAANIGYLLAAVLSMLLLEFTATTESVLLFLGLSKSTADYLLAHSAWRLLMISGALPAFLIMLIRLFVPESEKWEAERDRGHTSHWANVDLFGVLLGSAGALTIIWAWSPAGTSAPMTRATETRTSDTMRTRSSGVGSERCPEFLATLIWPQAAFLDLHQGWN